MIHLFGRAVLFAAVAACLLSNAAIAGGRADIAWQVGGFRLILSDLQVSPRGDVFAASPSGGIGDADTTIKLFRTSDGLLAQTFVADKNVSKLAFSSDGQLLAATHSNIIIGEGVRMEVWSVALGSRLRFITTGTQRSFSGITFGTQTPWLMAAAISDGTIRLLDAESGQSVQELTSHHAAIVGFAFSPDERQFISTSSDGKTVVWQREANGQYTELMAFQEAAAVSAMDVTRDGGLVGLKLSNGTLVVRRVSDGSARTIPLDLPVNQVKFSPEGGVLALSLFTPNNRIKFYDVASLTEAYEIAGNVSWIPGIAFSPDGSRFFYVVYPRDVKMAERTPEGRYEYSQDATGFNSTAFAVRFSPDGRTIASGAAVYGGLSQLGEVKIWDASNGSLQQALTGHTNGVYSVSFDRSGLRLASTAWDKTVRIWQRASAEAPFELIQVLNEHTNKVNQGSFSPDDRLFAAASDDHTVILWEALENGTYQYFQTLSHDAIVEPMVFSRDGSLLIAGGHDQLIKIWHQQSDGTYANPDVLAHSGQVDSLAITSDSRLLAAGGSDGLIQIWQRQADGSFTLRNVLNRQNGEIHALAYSPDNYLLVSAAEGQVSFWSTEDDSNIFAYDQETGAGSYTSLRGIALQGLAFSPDATLFAYARVDATITVAKNPYAFSARPRLGDPLPGLTGAQLNSFVAGRVAFEAQEAIADGLGPVFNERSCAGCHGQTATGGSGSFVATMFGRIADDGTFDPMVDFGGPLIQRRGITWVDGHNGDLPCHYVGETVPPEAAIVAGRRTPQLFGLGLVDAVPDATLFALADEEQAESPERAGIANVVPDVVHGGSAAGKFGWKAQNPSLLQFSADAYLNEVGITNPYFPDENCPQGDCELLRCNPVPGINDLDGANTRAFAHFMTLLAPAPRGRINHEVERGEMVFAGIGCDFCHRPNMRTGASEIAPLDHAEFHPYSDFLLHDVGLGDGITQSLANGNLIRTAPLWGLRTHTAYLHDGRAASVEEAILAHDRQAANARDAYQGLPPRERRVLLEFLESL